MPSIYNSPTKTMSSIFIHTGNLAVNQIDGGTTPAEFAGLDDTVSAFTTNQILNEVGNSPPPFTHFDAGIIQAANYDEVVIHTIPVVQYISQTQASAVSVSGTTIQDFAQVAATGKPFWVLIQTNGYGVTELGATATAAINTAINAVNVLYATLLNALLIPNFRGFAFLRPDLNVSYTDGSCITRKQQNLLVQTCWNLNCACCFLTTRPYETMTLIGRNIINDSNQNKFLDHPIIGCNPAFTDKLIVCYPSIRALSQNISIMLGQAVSMIQANNRDPGFSLNLSYAYVMPTDDAFWTADGTGGLTPVNSGSYAGFIPNMQAVFNFLGALGYTQMGLFGLYSLAQTLNATNIPSPIDFLPTDNAVNTTGSFTAWADSGNVYVAYSDGNGGNIVRQFNSANFAESAYTGNYP